MTDRLIPVYPPGQIDRGGNLVNVPTPSPTSVVVVGFRPTDRIETGQVHNIGSDIAQRIVGGNPLRRVIQMTNEGAVDVYIGNAEVTATTGYRIGIGATTTLETGGDVYAVTSPGAAGVVFWLAEMDPAT